MYYAPCWQRGEKRLLPKRRVTREEKQTEKRMGSMSGLIVKKGQQRYMSSLCSDNTERSKSQRNNFKRVTLKAWRGKDEAGKQPLPNQKPVLRYRSRCRSVRWGEGSLGTKQEIKQHHAALYYQLMYVRAHRACEEGKCTLLRMRKRWKQWDRVIGHLPA